MKRVGRWLVVTCGVLLLSFSPAHAMEFHVSVSNTLSYLYYSQTGHNGFFGPYNVDRSVGDFPPIVFDPVVDRSGDAAVANGWLGTGMGLVSGADGSTCSVSTSFFPTFNAFEFFSLIGVYRAGNVELGAAPGVAVAFANGEWLQLYAVLETPWGAVSYGKRPFGFGLGLQYDSSNRTEEYLALVTNWGPMQFGLGVYPSRQGIDLAQARDMSGNPFAEYANPSDRSGRPRADLFGFVTYEQGRVEMGVGGIYASQHAGPEGAIGGENRSLIPSRDLTLHEGWAYIKYFDGRFFFNGEIDWNYRTVKFKRPLGLPPSPPDWLVERLVVFPVNVTTGQDAVLFRDNQDGSGSIFRPQYSESWRYMVEAGFIKGPLKASLLYAFVPGPDRRHGVLIDRQPVIVNPYLFNLDQVVWNPDHGNAGIFRAYSTLFGSAYGSGVGAVGRGGTTLFAAGEGYVVDASVFAARLDYAIAANLNVWGSLFKAKRTSHGYGWGYIKPAFVSGRQPYQVRYGFPAPPFGPLYRNFRVPIPAIPDDDLGWEVTTGLSWALLEGFNVDVSFAYWKPGRWFNFACIDRSVVAWDSPTAENNWGANPDRDINPVFGLTISTAVNF